MKRQRPFSMEQFEEQWICPISGEAMKDPVITEDGHSYERGAIERWLKIKRTSPKTGLYLQSTKLRQNISLRHVIQKFNNQIKPQLAKIIEANQYLAEIVESYQQTIQNFAQTKWQLQNLSNQFMVAYRDLQEKHQQLTQNYKTLQLSHNNLLKTHYNFKTSTDEKLVGLMMENKILRRKIQKESGKDLNQELLIKIDQQLPQEGIFQLSKEEYEQSLKLFNKQKIQKEKQKVNKNCQQLNQKQLQVEVEKKQIIKRPNNQFCQKSLLHFQDYLVRNPVFYDEQDKELDHREWPINMTKFLKYDWRQCRILKLNNCNIDDIAFDLFLDEAHNFRNLECLFLENNKIENIQMPKFYFQQFQNLKLIKFTNETIVKK